MMKGQFCLEGWDGSPTRYVANPDQQLGLLLGPVRHAFHCQFQFSTDVESGDTARTDGGFHGPPVKYGFVGAQGKIPLRPSDTPMWN